MREKKERTFQVIDLVVVAALVCVCTLILAAFFFYSEPGPGLGFQRINNRNTGEPISILGSLVIYGFIGGISYGLLASVLAVVVVEPIVAIHMVIKKMDFSRRDDWPGAGLGFWASFIFAAIVILVSGGSLCLGLRTI